RRSTPGHAAPASREGRTTSARVRPAGIHLHVDGEGPPPREDRRRLGHHFPDPRLLLGALERLLDVRIRERRGAGSEPRGHRPPARRGPEETSGTAAREGLHLRELLRRPRGVSPGPPANHHGTRRTHTKLKHRDPLPALP